MEEVKVAINVLNFNTYEKSKKCIISCLQQQDIKGRVILIDNKSSDDSCAKLIDEFGESIDVLKNDENYGYAGGNNLGVEYALSKGYEYSLILNSDIVLHGDHLVKNLVSLILTDSACAVVAPQIFNVTSNGLKLNTNDSSYLRALRMIRVLPPQPKDADSYIYEAQGSALLVKNSVFKKVGGFPEHFFMYGEEGFLAKKILWNGNTIRWMISDNEYALHFHDKSGKVDAWREYLMGRNRTLEYYENRSHALIRWSMVFWLFYVYYYIKHGKTPYVLGVKKGRRLYRNGASSEEIFQDGRMASSVMGG